MRRPIGVIAVAIYFVFLSINVFLNTLIYRPLSSIGFWFNSTFAVILVLISWGIFRLWSWARFAGMLIIMVGVGLTAPFFIIRERPFNASFFLFAATCLMNLFFVWYLFRSATAKHFSPMLKTA
jgi:hypothetical protein